MHGKPIPYQDMEPPEDPQLDRWAWTSAFVTQWQIYQQQADAWDIELGPGYSAADFSWENDGFELSGDEAAEVELKSRFDAIL